MLRIATEARHLRLEISIVSLSDLDVRVDDEDQLTPPRPEAFAPTTLAGLDNDGASLRRARYGERPARAKETALVVKTMNLFGDGEEAGRFVLNNSLIFPAIPMPEYDLHELVGAVVAQVVLDHLFTAHVVSFTVVERGDDVPGRASLGHQIERREQARDMERFVIACRIGCAEPKSLGRHAHDREHGDRVHFHAADAVANRMVVVAPVDVGH